LGIKHVHSVFEGGPDWGQSEPVRQPVAPSVELDGLVAVHVAAHTKLAKMMIGGFERRSFMDFSEGKVRSDQASPKLAQ
jgi:hypothetical protein